MATQSKLPWFPKDESQLPPEIRGKVTLQYLREIVENSNSLSILVAGKTGNGKSTLVNGIVGTDVAKEGGGPRRSGCTGHVTNYRKCDIEGVSVTVWDSPGLQDGSGMEGDYLEAMTANCRNVDLVLYCIKMTEDRFTPGNPDVIAMQKLTETFGELFWKRIIIILTFANSLESTDSTMMVATTSSQKKNRFDELLRGWKKIICDVLKEEVRLPPDIANNVRVVPAGHSHKPKLPGHTEKYWLSNLWHECVETVPNLQGAIALIVISYHRLVTAGQEHESNFEQSIERQSLVFTRMVSAAKYVCYLIATILRRLYIVR